MNGKKEEKAANGRFDNDDVALELYKRDLTCFIVHFVFCIIFFSLGVWQMGIYNVFSTLFFLVLAYGIRSQWFTDFKFIESLNSAEIMIHCLLAVYFVGFELGYQYILFTLTIPIAIQANDKRFLHLNAWRTIFVGAVYILLFIFLRYNVLQPRYTFSATVSVVITSFIIMMVFLMVNSQLIADFRNFEKHILEFKEKELITAQKINDVQKAVIGNIAGVIEDRDISTGEHTARTTEYVEAICDELMKENKFTDFLTKDMRTCIVHSAALHDIGKIKTPDAILNKPGKLTTEEFEVMKKHTVDGGMIIRKTFQGIDDKQYEDVAYNIVMYHHEKWNGEGYPEGLKESEIPLPARIMAVADEYDALISKRVYKDAFTKDTALQIIIQDSGTHFDPDVVQAFIKVL